jgi:hypothetical protein
VQAVTGRKEKTPNYKEIAAAQEQGLDVTKAIAYKAAALASLSGYAGFLGDTINGLMAREFKNQAQMYNNPLLSAASDFTRELGDLKEAMQNGDTPKVLDVINQVLQDHIQTYRIALQQFGEDTEKQIDRANKFRDIKVFKNLADMPVQDISADRPNPYLNADIKEFKQTDDMGRAIELLPNIIQKAMEDSRNSEGNLDVEKLRTKLKGLKANSFQIFPSPESNPPNAYLKYLQFLDRTQGHDAAQARLMEYMMQRAKNQAKSSAVPTL